MDFMNMTLDELLKAVPAQIEALRQSIPIEKRHEFNVVEQQVKQAIKKGDMSAMLQLQAKYGVYKSPFEK